MPSDKTKEAIKKHHKLHFTFFEIITLIVFTIGIGTILYGAFRGCKAIYNAFELKNNKSINTVSVNSDNTDNDAEDDDESEADA